MTIEARTWSKARGDVGEGLQAKEHRWPLRGRKDKETDSPLKPLEGAQLYLTSSV